MPGTRNTKAKQTASHKKTFSNQQVKHDSIAQAHNRHLAQTNSANKDSVRGPLDWVCSMMSDMLYDVFEKKGAPEHKSISSTIS